MADHIIARFIGGPTIRMACDPGVDGADQLDATWRVGKVVNLVDDDLYAHRGRCLDWFQPDGPTLTIYTFQHERDA